MGREPAQRVLTKAQRSSAPSWFQRSWTADYLDVEPTCCGCRGAPQRRGTPVAARCLWDCDALGENGDGEKPTTLDRDLGRPRPAPALRADNGDACCVAPWAENVLVGKRKVELNLAPGKAEGGSHVEAPAQGRPAVRGGVHRGRLPARARKSTGPLRSAHGRACLSGCTQRCCR